MILHQIVVITIIMLCVATWSALQKSAVAESPEPCAALSVELDGWSQATSGLQVRLELVEKPKLHGARWLVPYFQLRNVRDLGNPMEVPCDNRHLKVELVDKEGKVVRDGWSLKRSGPTPDPGTMILPRDSSMRFSLECRNWGIPKNTAAMVSTDSGAWVIAEKEKGKVFLRATLIGEETEPRWKGWHGEIQTPLVPVDWK